MLRRCWRAPVVEVGVVTFYCCNLLFVTCHFVTFYFTGINLFICNS